MPLGYGLELLASLRLAPLQHAEGIPSMQLSQGGQGGRPGQMGRWAPAATFSPTSLHCGLDGMPCWNLIQSSVLDGDSPGWHQQG